MISIRQAQPDDSAAIWRILEPIIRAGDVYAVTPSMGEQEVLAFWSNRSDVFIAEIDGAPVGTAYIKPNNMGGGSHVANAGFATDQSRQGEGVGRALGEFIVQRAAEQGYLAMQFNFVVSTNTRAVGLWQSLGFDIIGVLPGAFKHPSQGLVDVYVMFLTLGNAAKQERR